MLARDLRGQVVVITGASSGLGKAAALEFAKRGSQLVLAARREEQLAETAAECRKLGARADFLPTDVTDEAQMESFCQFALGQAGRIDVWVNNAGVTMFAPLEGGTLAEHRRVIETNLFGAIIGARLVTPIFRRQGRGVLINVCSILSKVGQPFVPSYIISKFALRGLTEALRAEFADDPNIHACSLLPYTIDTPHFQSGANYHGQQAHALPPVMSPQTVARAVVALAERPRRELHVPRAALLGLVLHGLFPRPIERLISLVLKRWQFSPAPEPKHKPGNVFRPDDADGRPHGNRPPQLNSLQLTGWLVQVLALRAARTLLKPLLGQQAGTTRVLPAAPAVRPVTR